MHATSTADKSPKQKRKPKNDISITLGKIPLRRGGKEYVVAKTYRQTSAKNRHSETEDGGERTRFLPLQNCRNCRTNSNNERKNQRETEQAPGMKVWIRKRGFNFAAYRHRGTKASPINRQIGDYGKKRKYHTRQAYDYGLAPFFGPAESSSLRVTALPGNPNRGNPEQ